MSETHKPYNKEDSLLLHIFVDHLYMSVLPNLEQAYNELKEFGQENPDSTSDDIVQTYNWLKGMIETLREGYDVFANTIEIVPNLEAMNAFKDKLEKELACVNGVK